MQLDHCTADRFSKQKQNLCKEIFHHEGGTWNIQVSLFWNCRVMLIPANTAALRGLNVKVALCGLAVGLMLLISWCPIKGREPHCAGGVVWIRWILTELKISNLTKCIIVSSQFPTQLKHNWGVKTSSESQQVRDSSFVERQVIKMWFKSRGSRHRGDWCTPRVREKSTEKNLYERLEDNSHQSYN